MLYRKCVACFSPYGGSVCRTERAGGLGRGELAVFCSRRCQLALVAKQRLRSFHANQPVRVRDLAQQRPAPPPLEVRSIPCSLPPHFDLILPGSLPVKPVQYFHPYPSIQSYLHNGERTMHMRRYVRGRFPRPRRTTNFSFQGTPARFFPSRSSQARRAASETWHVSCSVPRPLRALSLVSPTR